MGISGLACNVHDICYSQVGTVRGACDDELDINMGNTCQEYYGCYYDHETHSIMCNGTTQQLQGCHNYRNTIMNAIRGFASGIMAARFETLQEEAACRAWHNARYVESTCLGP
jgi:hypothetical protein